MGDVKDFTPAKRVILDNWGNVGGTAEFPAHRNKLTISQPKWTTSIEEIATAEVSGDSLNGENIKTGDTLICKVIFDVSEIKDGKLVLVQLPCGRTVVKRIYLSPDKVTLRSSNCAYKDLIYDKGEIKIVAIVKGLERSFE